MKRRFTKLMAALALLTCLVPLTGWGQTRTDYEWVLVEDYSSLSTDDTYVIASNINSGTTWYSLKNNQVTSAGNLPIGSTLTISNNKITSTVSEDETWVLEVVTNQSDQFYIKSTKGSYYLQNANATGSKITSKSSTDAQNIWKIHYTDTNNSNTSVTGLYNVGVHRELACYNSNPVTWRCYSSGNYSNIKNDEVVLYKRQEVSTDPTITLSKTSLTGFNYVQGAGPSASQSFKVSGTNLENAITVSLDENSNYEMSAQDGDNWLTINSIELPVMSGTVGETTLYVRMKSGLTGSEITGTITATSEGATEKFISLSGSVTPTYTLTYSATNGSISGASGATPVVSGTALVEGTTVALTAVPSSGFRFVSWSDGGTNATLSSTTDNPTTFTMGTANVTVTATFEVIPTHTVTFSVNGETTTTDFAEGAAIDFPSDPEGINGMSFMGWVESAIIGTTDEAPSFVTSATMGTSNLTYYAVFAMATSDTPVEMVQTLQYDSWTYGGSTTNKNGYRLFHNGGYVESAAFDLSKLTKVVVYGGTFGGDQYNSLTIGDGTNVWKAVTVSGSSQTGVNTYTNGNALTGTKKLRVTSTCGSSNSSGVRMSKVEIYITAIPYAYYCTTVPAALPPVITVAENPFVISTTATITCATPEAIIKYSFDNENWENYSTALTINTSTTIYAKAVKDSNESTVSSVVVTKNLAEPTVTIDASGITNTNVFNGTDAGSLTATVTYNETPIEGATVTWSGSNDEVATIDANTGVVTLVAAGSVTFTATYAGNSDYSEKTATYNMTVTYNNPNGAGTRCNPYTVAEAKDLMADWTANTTSPTDVYVIGIVCSVSNPSSNSQKYYISDDGENTNTIYIYNGKGLGGANMTSDNALAVGEQVIVKGKLLKYQQNNNLIDEFNAGSVLVLEIYAYDDNEDGENESYDCYRVIEGYGSTAGSYYLVASPIDMEPNENGVNMITDDGTDPENYSYDLYSFDQSQNQEWRNYRQGAYNIVPGKGYLYANKENVTINFWGEPTVNNSTTLSKTANAEFEGMNLVGNPLVTKAYIGRSFYIMNSEGTELIVSQRNFILPMEGVFVSAVGDGEPLSFSNEAPVVNPGKGNLNIQVAQVVSSRGTTPAIDRAMISFNGNDMLPKFQLNPNSTKVYIPQGNKDYAVVRSNAQGEMPVSFKAENNGTYTLSVNAENVEMSYLHLIDNMTGADVDLLATPSYTFEAKTSDYASRFRLMFSANSISEDADGDNAFAYFNGSNWTISNMGEATLQVVDVMGRVISSEQINGNAEININQPAGVYMIRLVSGDSVKVQKVVVR